MGDNVERVTSGIRKSEWGWQLDYVSETFRKILLFYQILLAMYGEISEVFIS